MQFQQIARQVISHEQDKGRTSEELAAASVRVYAKLLAFLSSLLGEAGSLALFRRSLRLTEPTFAFFSSVRDRDAKSDTLLTAVGACLHSQRPEVIMDASVELLTKHIELLATFIGQRLTRQLLQEAWPDLRISSEETLE